MIVRCAQSMAASRCGGLGAVRRVPNGLSVRLMMVLSVGALPVGCSSGSPASPDDGGDAVAEVWDGDGDDGGPEDGQDGPADEADAGEADTPSPLSQIPEGTEWIDVHMHCDAEAVAGPCEPLEVCCPSAAWLDIQGDVGPAFGVLLSLEHFVLGEVLGDTTPEPGRSRAIMNEAYAARAARETTLGFFASLECLSSVPIDDPGFVDACRADVDRWLEAGAMGFKDHIGKAFDQTGGNDGNRWLGLWNRFNGFCTVPAGDLDPNLRCVEQRGVRYPALEPRWREVLRYVTETRGVPVISHATSWGGPEVCWDDRVEAPVPCSALTSDHVLDLAAWADRELSDAAARRLILAHLAFLDDEPDRLAELLDHGVSVDTAARPETVLRGGCEARSFFGRYGDRILFGTDRKPSLDCLAGEYAAWLYAFEGDLGVARDFAVCGGTERPIGMQLAATHVDGCAHDVPPGTLDNVLRGNFLRILGE